MPPETDQEKTEEPTPKKLQKAREEGNVAKSKDMSDTAVLFAAVITLYMLHEHFLTGMLEMMHHYLDFSNRSFPSINEMQFFVVKALLQMLGIIWPLFLALVMFALAINIGQVGLLWSTKAIAPKASKLNPIKGIAQKFSMKNLVDLTKSILKVSVFGPIAYFIAKAEFNLILSLMYMEPIEIFAIALSIVFKIWIVIILIMLIVAAVDFYFQKYQHHEKLKMTKQEVKEERKQSDGNPEVKQRIRSLQREMAMKRMMGDVPESDVVITNPLFLAVALKYDSEVASAPYMVAKGQELIAQRIRDLALENDIPIYQDPLLARQLYDAMEPGDEISHDLYQAVAEILAEIYRQNGKI
ncbi:flagellar biosynthesis protein FlhB [Desulfurispira natronophila]|uniref:Flagellar biosynthetic protein FlhB n=1 Tax=Desulfurispira natronophila TaxID=682562 RepID=A0A7W8DGH6_9BACT|nr:flagellar biosynthetic protein FlhB [Desulfurispira natronophila]